MGVEDHGRTWHPLVVRGELNADLRAAMHGKSGVYAARRKGRSGVAYVGQSSCGKLWRTMLRHFQDPALFKSIGRASFGERSPVGWEIAYEVTSSGNRLCRAPKGDPSNKDPRAVDLETEWMADLEPSVNLEEVVDADDSFDFGANERDDDERAADDGGEFARWHASNPGRSTMTVRRANPGASGEPDFREVLGVWTSADSMIDRVRYEYMPKGEGDDEWIHALLPRRGWTPVIDFSRLLDAKESRALAKVLTHVARDPFFANMGEKVIAVAESCPPLPPKFPPRPWDMNGGSRSEDKYFRTVVYDRLGRNLGWVRDPGFGRAIALAVTLAELGAELRRIKVTAKTSHPERMLRVAVDADADLRRKEERLEERLAKGGGKKTSEETREELRDVMHRRALLAIAAEAVQVFAGDDPARFEAARAREEQAKREALEEEHESARASAWRVLEQIDGKAEIAETGGPPFFAHAIRKDGSPIATGKADDPVTALRRLNDGMFDVMVAERRAREGRELEGRAFRGKAAARFARPAPQKRPAGYGEIDRSAESKGKGGGAQLRMFNPRGPLTELGALTAMAGKDARGRVVELSWPLKDAPRLAYDARGRLFIVYRGASVRPSTAAERRVYARTHWGLEGDGKVRDGGVAVPPWRDVMSVAESITYTTTKGTDAELVDYVHAWGEGARGAFTPPRVVEHACAKACGAKCPARGAFALLGGSYTVNERGIVG